MVQIRINEPSPVVKAKCWGEENGHSNTGQKGTTLGVHMHRGDLSDADLIMYHWLEIHIFKVFKLLIIIYLHQKHI